jgi:hypothetical protein
VKPLEPASRSAQLPRGTLAKVNLGQSFAEYDKLLAKPYVFVDTPAIHAALDPLKSKCVFVGRRGTGKTAITYYVAQKRAKASALILPQIFAPMGKYFTTAEVCDPRQRDFKSLVVSFKRALADEVVREWTRRGLYRFRKAPDPVSRERNLIEDYDFDSRLIVLFDEIFQTLKSGNDREWLRCVNRAKEICDCLDEVAEGSTWTTDLLIDRIDESWDGSDNAVMLLMALMHSCVELTTAVNCVRPLLFLRENIFERVRAVDREFSRLETFVVSLDWTRELLLELIERRLNLPLTAKLPLRGPTWQVFFEDSSECRSQDHVFEYCQFRPRDVLTYCAFAIESAQAHRHHRVAFEDLQAARRRFSDNRFKDLCDEYSENYPQIQLVLGRFYGLGREFTLNGMTSFIKKLLVDDDVKQYCATWIFKYTQPERFIELLFSVGFVGIRAEGGIIYRSLGPQSATLPVITLATTITVHPTYVDALNLQNMLVGHLDDATPLQKSGIVAELPGAVDLNDYNNRLNQLLSGLKDVPHGEVAASMFEDLVGDVIRLCFFRVLTNVEHHSRNIDGRVVRDWIAANTASSGFWETIRLRYQATQIVWECKNYQDLDASDFQQAAYYMTKEIGRFVVVAYRGESKPHYFQHIKRVAAEKDGGVILLLGERDLAVFLRQALNGKNREDHIREIYDKTVRLIS